MGKLASFLTVLLAVNLCSRGQLWGQQNQKLAQTGMQFLSVVSDARAAAMAGAVTTLQMKSASLFFNPACMAESKSSVDFSGSVNWWIADIKHYAASLSWMPMSGDLGVFGASVQYVDYGEILGTSYAPFGPGYVDNGPVKAYGIAAGIGYAKALSEAFSVGGQVRYVFQRLGDSEVPAGTDVVMKRNRANVLSFDFGTIFKPGFKSFAFGMSVRNFSKQIAYEQESFELPLTFKIGVSMDLMDLANDRSIIHAAYLSVDAVHNRDYYEQVNIGGDLEMLDALSLRAGYITNSDEQGVTMGFGVHRFGLAVDYAYTPFGVFTNAQRVTVRYSL